MKTAKEKALEWLQDAGNVFNDDDVKSLTLLLKEQDRDTRHNCAEAVLEHGGAPSLEMIDRCHNACMNARAV